MKYAFAFLLPLLVVACGGNNETDTEVVAPTVEVTEPTIDTETMPADAGMVSINETVDAVNAAGGDITAIAPSAAVTVIDGWIMKLNGMPEASGIVSNLTALKGQLATGAPNGRMVGELLTKLGAETKTLAASSGNMALDGLANALSAGGAKLGGM